MRHKNTKKGYGDLTERRVDCVAGRWDLMVAVLSEKLDFKAQIMKRAMGGFGRTG